MSNRPHGLLKLPGNFEVSYAEPLDARQRVKTKASLFLQATWLNTDGNIYLYKGILVSVYDDTEDNNGVYRLIADDYTLEASWEKLGTGSGGDDATYKGLLQIDVDKTEPYDVANGYLDLDTASITEGILWTNGDGSNYVRSVHYANGYIYSGFQNGNVRKTDENGNTIWTNSDHTDNVYGLTYTENHLYTSSDDTTLKKVDNDGNNVWTYSEFGTSWAQDLDYDSDGNIYCAVKSGSLHKVNSSGTQVWTASVTGAYSVAVDRINEFVYVGGQAGAFGTVTQLDFNGNVIWTNTDATGTINKIAIDSDGYIYAGGGAFDENLYKIDIDGNNVWTNTDNFEPIRGVVIDSVGNIYTLAQALIRKFTPDNTSLWVFADASLSGTLPDMDIGDNNVLYTGDDNNTIFAITQDSVSFSSDSVAEINGSILELDQQQVINVDDYLVMLNDTGTIYVSTESMPTFNSVKNGYYIGDDRVIGSITSGVFTADDTEHFGWTLSDMTSIGYAVGDTGANGNEIKIVDVPNQEISEYKDTVYDDVTTPTQETFTTQAFTNIIIIENDEDGNMYVYDFSGDYTIYRINLDGSTEWSYVLPTPRVSRMVYHNGFIYIGNNDGSIKKINKDTGVVVWTNTDHTNNITDLYVNDGKVYSININIFGTDELRVITTDNVAVWNYTETTTKMLRGIAVYDDITYVTAFHSNNFTLYKFDVNGDLVEEILLQDYFGENTVYTVDIKIVDGYLYIAQNDSILTNETNSFLKMDLFGNVLFEKQVDYRIVKFDVTSDYYYTMTGTNPYSLIKYDSDGEIIWTYEIPVYANDFVTYDEYIYTPSDTYIDKILQYDKYDTYYTYKIPQFTINADAKIEVGGTLYTISSSESFYAYKHLITYDGTSYAITKSNMPLYDYDKKGYYLTTNRVITRVVNGVDIVTTNETDAQMSRLFYKGNNKITINTTIPDIDENYMSIGPIEVVDGVEVLIEGEWVIV